MGLGQFFQRLFGKPRSEHGHAALRPSTTSKQMSKLAAAYSQSARPDNREIPSPDQTAPQWKVVEPPPSEDSVPHAEARLLEPQPGWRLVGASVRGRLHAHQGSWRDDAFTWSSADGWTIVAVADGAGSAPLSRVASHLACAEAVATLSQRLTGFTLPADASGEPSPEARRQLRDFLVAAMKTAKSAVQREAMKRSRPEQEFNTTLLLAVYGLCESASIVAAVQVGDGVIGVRTAEGCRILGEADHGAYSSETRFLTTPGIDEQWERRVVIALAADLQAVVVCTDGVADDFYPEDHRLIELFTGDPIPEMHQADAPMRGLDHVVLPKTRAELALSEWLGYEKRGSSDDRTLVVMYRATPQLAEESA
jgi:hypothetical protein